MTRSDRLDIMAVGLTHVGRVRENNEDSLYVDVELGLFLVADGMGGHASGEVASCMAVDLIREAYGRSHREADGQEDLAFTAEAILQSIQQANQAIFRLSEQEPSYRGMGTTLAGLAARKDRVFLFHVGDSRIYRLHNGSLEQMTEDHSLVAQQVRMGIITEEQARTSRARNVITRALGVQWEVEVELQVQRWEEGDLYMLCSDGLSDLVPRETMERFLLSHGQALEEASRALLREALDRGGHDNVSIVVLRLGKPNC
ncbi:MAG: Stp1/IreP family PP2C-type Ser/Thr phosphatase [Thermodesulfobacteriota bacterium]